MGVSTLQPGDQLSRRRRDPPDSNPDSYQDPDSSSKQTSPAQRTQKYRPVLLVRGGGRRNLRHHLRQLALRPVQGWTAENQRRSPGSNMYQPLHRIHQSVQQPTTEIFKLS